jgi:hypothetical protein
MKITIKFSVCIFIVLETFFANAQVKVMHQGHTGLGTVNPSAVGPIREQVSPSDQLTIHAFNKNSGLLVFFDQDPNSQIQWYQSICTKVDKWQSANYVVSCWNGVNYKDIFYVRGDGIVYSNGGYYLGSDSALKYNIKPMSNSLEKVLKLNGVYYKLKSERNTSSESDVHIGFIAQELESVVPEVVKDMHDGIKAVNYPTLVSLLAEAIKEQQAQIETLKIEISELKEIANHHSNNSFGTGSHNSITSKAYLDQNQPNPFNEITHIKYFIPQESINAIVKIYSSGGEEIKTFTIEKNGTGDLLINGGSMSPGTYIYSLFVDGKQIDSKLMILTRN